MCVQKLTKESEKDKLLEGLLLAIDEFENNPVKDDAANDTLIDILSTRFESIKG